jgi:hypothetical protein
MEYFVNNAQLMRTFIVVLIVSLAGIGAASAEPFDSSTTFMPPTTGHNPWRVDWLTAGTPVPSARPFRLDIQNAAAQQTTSNQPVHAAAVTHSDAYLLRAKIHRMASWATLPLFASQLALGAAIWDGGGDNGWKKGAHAAVGAGIVGLFGVNTATGAWNLFGESWNDSGRGMRLVHGLLMMAADAGFVATSISTPSEHRGLNFVADRDTHRNLAITSIGLGTAGYLIMLVGNH